VSVSKQLLVDLVTTWTHAQKWHALREQVLKEVGDRALPVTFRCGEFNVTVSLVPGRMSARKDVSIVQVTEPVDLQKQSVEIGAQGAAVYGSIEGASPSPSERTAAQLALDALEGGFHWYSSSRGHKFWVYLCNDLRRVVGRPPIGL
jgi:hypothetical protein